jgi:hypothetical protein
MGYTTSIPEPERERGDGPPPVEGVDIEASRAKDRNLPKKHMSESEIPKDVADLPEEPDYVSKTVEPEKKSAPKKSSARSKSK